MSVIENAIKRLQASRGGAAAVARDRHGAAHRPEGVSEGAAGVRTLPLDLDALREAGLLPPAHQ
jgi:hypothetical protein